MARHQRQFHGLDPRCLRFLRACFPGRHLGGAISRAHLQDHFDDHGHSRHAALGGIGVRLTGGSLRAAPAPHGQCSFLFSVRVAVRLCPQLHGVPDSAGDPRNRDGRRVGSWGVARHGERAETLARNSIRNCAERISDRLSAGGGCSPLCPPNVGLARDVLGGWNPRPVGFLHTFSSEGVGSLEAAPRPHGGRNLAYRQRALEDFLVPRSSS